MTSTITEKESTKNKKQVPYVLACLEGHPEPTIVPLPYGRSIGGTTLAVIGGPCAIESEKQLMAAAEAVKAAGGTILRGGAYKPRSSPYAFQGMGEKGLKLLQKAGRTFELPVITEVMDQDDLHLAVVYADIIQIGARNCQNFALLKKAGTLGKPVLLKRGSACTIDEYLCAAEYILAGGNREVILCERGIKTFARETRSTLDISAVPVLKNKTHLPVVVDPSHAAGTWKLVPSLSLAGIAAGADGLMIEVHPEPEKAECDGPQSLKPDKFKILMKDVKRISGVLGKKL